MSASTIRIHDGEEIVEFQLPEGWYLVGNPKTGRIPLIGREEMIRALENPIGKPRLEQLARGKKNAVIIASDVTRPVRGEEAIPLLLNILNRAGIPDRQIQLIMGGGSHVPPEDLQKAYHQKYGSEVVGRVKVLYHDPDRDLVCLGTTRRGHRVEISRQVAEADLKIGFGGILPHALGGYSGGAKSILPAVASRETIIQNHLMVVEPGVGMGLVEGNPIREEMEEVAEMAGLDFIFNLVINTEGQPVGAVSGDFKEAHREGVRLAREIYQGELVRPAQVVFTSGHPFDIHFYQSLNGPCAALNGCVDGGTIIHLTRAYEGIRPGTKKLFSTVNRLGYRDLFERLRRGEREGEEIRPFFYPEINIGVGTTIFRAMFDRQIRIVVVTRAVGGEELRPMGFEHATNLEEAVAMVHRRIPEAEVAAQFNAKVILSATKPK